MPGKPTLADSIRVLQQMAVLLEYQGESIFRIRAYDTAIAALQAQTASLGELAAEPGRLETLPGIGKALAGLVREVAAGETGADPPELAELKAKAPRELFKLREIQGLGAKKIRALHEQLGVETIEQLKAAIAEGRVSALKGFGARSAEKFLAGIEVLERFSGHELLSVALAAAEQVVARLGALPEVERIEIAGSLRRRREVVRDIDLVAASQQPAAVMAAFIAMEDVRQVLGHGETKSSVVLASGLQADLRVVAPEQFGTALHHFTGSKDAHVQLRAFAQRAGLSISEYGIAPVGADGAIDNGARETFADEAALYARLELPFIAPELREAAGELEAAAAGRLPCLLESGDYRGVLHCHSTWSDGAASIEDMALAARDEHGWEYFGLCDHSVAAAYAGGVRPEALASQHAEIDAVNARFAAQGSDFRVLKGTEADILGEGELDYTPEILASMDLVVASVHSRFTQNYEEMTARLIAAVRNPYTSVLGHPSGRLLLVREPYEFDVDAVLRAAAETGTAIEINADPHRLDLDWRYCRRALELGCKLSINPDAHSTGGLANVRYGIEVARKGWVEAKDVINCLGLAELRAWLTELRAKKLATAK